MLDKLFHTHLADIEITLIYCHNTYVNMHDLKKSGETNRFYGQELRNRETTVAVVIKTIRDIYVTDVGLSFKTLIDHNTGNIF